MIETIKVKGWTVTDADFREHLNEEQYNRASQDELMRGALALMVVDSMAAMAELKITPQFLRKIQ